MLPRDEGSARKGNMSADSTMDRIFLANATQQLVDACHGAALKAGWWTNWQGEPTISNPMCFSQKLMLIVSELAEAMEGDRKSLFDEHIPQRPSREVELADALIRIFDLAGAYEMDLGGALVEKMAYNSQRSDHKLENRALENGKKY